MKSVREFLKEIGFIQTWEEMQPVEAAFADHMKKGLAGEKSSLPMLPAYLTVDALPEEGQDVIVMDAGGTNLRCARMRFAADGSIVTDAVFGFGVLDLNLFGEALDEAKFTDGCYFCTVCFLHN